MFVYFACRLWSLLQPLPKACGSQSYSARRSARSAGKFALVAILAALVVPAASCRKEPQAVQPPPVANGNMAGESAVPAPPREQENVQAATTAATSAASIDKALEVAIAVQPDWYAGDEVEITLEVNNHGDHPIEGLELRGEVQFGLQDTISDGRVRVPVVTLPAQGSYRTVLQFLSLKPGEWYIKAAIYREEELIKATARRLIIQERPRPESAPPQADDAASLGPPLVDHPERLQPLSPTLPVWLDSEGRSVVMIGRVCQREAPLELFACLKNFKEHESVVSINTRAYIVHAGLLALGAEPGHPVQFYPEYRAAEGPEIDITVVWKDEKGEIQHLPAQQWVRETRSKEAMKYPWIFTGSEIVKDPDTGEQYYAADTTGELICVSNFPSAVLDLPIRSTDSNEALLFEAFTENIPPIGTPVTVILTPKESKPAAPQSTPNTPGQAAENSSPDTPGQAY